MRRAKRPLAFVPFALVTAFLLLSCSSKPSAGDAERAIRDQIRDQSEGRIKLVTFHKTNGQEAELFGVQLYILAYEAEIEFAEDCKWVRDPFSAGHGFRTVIPPKQGRGFTWSGFLDNTMNPGTLMKKGQRQKLKGSVTFEKTERGWRATNI